MPSNDVTKEVSEWLERERKFLEQSTIRFALLAIIAKYQDKGGIYGYKIGEELSVQSQGNLLGKDGSFYAILRKLTQDNLVETQSIVSPEGPMRKHYFLTEKGIRVYNALYSNWEYNWQLITMLYSPIDNEKV